MDGTCEISCSKPYIDGHYIQDIFLETAKELTHYIQWKGQYVLYTAASVLF